MSFLGGPAVPNPLNTTEFNNLKFQQKFNEEKEEFERIKQKSLKDLDNTSSFDLVKEVRKRDKQTKEIENEYDHFFINVLYLQNTREKDLSNSSYKMGEFMQEPSSSEKQLKV